jgi:flavocytochrome c
MSQQQQQQNKVIVIGGGLAGLSAAHTILENGGSVVLLDKSAFLGGNSTKATSGINGAPTKTQKLVGGMAARDSAEAFEQDCLKGAAGVNHTTAPEHTIPLAKVLAHGSGSAVDWLVDRFNLDLSLISQLGGHSYPRTHRGKARFPGFTITYALMEALEEVCEKTNNEKAQIITKANVKRLLKDATGAVVGCEYSDKKGQTQQAFGPVVVCTGGYGADYTNTSLLSKYRPDVTSLPTTNGDHCTGDGIKMAQEIGAGVVDMESVQVHPTGLVNPSEPEAKVKFLAAEALRGVGGILLDANGNRFCDELGRRDYVSGEMNRNKGPFRLILNGKASKEIEWHCKHYVGRGIMKKFNSGNEVAREMGIDPSHLRETFEKYNRCAQTKACPFGKKFFHNAPLDMNDPTFHVAIVCTVVHYTMGGLRINDDSQVLDANERPIPGLFCAGEAAGGVHGRNRLGGNSLLDCVVFGRVAGMNIVKQLRSGGGGGNVNAYSRITDAQGALNRVANINGHFNPKMGAKTTASSSGGLTEAEVAKRDKENDCWVILHGKVYDVTEFLPDHPGGKKAIMLFAGKDATEEFDMLHPPNVLKKYLPPEAMLGELVG